MKDFPSAVAALVVGPVHRLATCWKVERTDGVTLRFCDHSSPLVFGGETYEPAGGFDASARQMPGDANPQNAEIRGVLSSEAITEADLAAGLYRDAKVTEYLVDWLYPWAGAIDTRVYWVGEMTFTGETWEAELEGLPRMLKHAVGDVYSRSCRHDLGDASCGVNLADFAQACAVAAVTTDRLAFTVSGLTEADGYFDDGSIEWTSGLNQGRTSEVKSYVQVGGAFTLHLKTPSAINAGDDFTLYPGCDKLVETCHGTFGNVERFGGFPHMPGSDATLRNAEQV